MDEYSFIFLDGDEERRLLVKRIQETRQAVLNIIENIPEAEWYTPRYHGWSPAAMIGHLNLMDNLNLLLVKMALLNLRPRVLSRSRNRFNDRMARIFMKRRVPASLRSARRNEARICDFIMRLPIARFSKQVYHAQQGKYITVENAVQALFLHHWQEHLRTMQGGEHISPPEHPGGTVNNDRPEVPF